jgi:hypothetical protein
MAEEKRMKVEFEYVDDDSPVWVTYPLGATEEKPLSPENERILRAIQIQRLRELLKRHPPRPST